MSDPTPTHWYLKQVDLFRGISDEEIMKIADKVVERKCHKKELLYTPFDDAESVCILKKGEVTLYYSHNGKRLVIDTLQPGSIFGNINFTPHQKNTHFAEVTQDAYICFFALDDFLKIVQAKPQVMLRLLQLMSDRLANYERKLESGLFDAKEKVLRYLELEEKTDDSLLNRLFGRKSRLTHSKIAQATGLSRETVSRIMSELKKV